MSRMRKLIANHMTTSKSISAHVTSFNEVDMTKIVNWRKKIKDKFQSRENQNITFTPIIIEAIVKAIIDFPMLVENELERLGYPKALASPAITMGERILGIGMALA